MKTEEIPFSLEEYNKGGCQVVDGAKRNIRIVCTDQQDSTYPIVGLVSVSKHSEYIRTYTESGIYILKYPDNKEMNLLCHDYPGLAYGILINTKTSYALPDIISVDSLVRAANEANLKATSVTTAIEQHDENSLITLHFKTFIHLEKNTKFTRILESAIDLHLKEIDEIISPYFKDMHKEEK